jgi:hypothetical protein
MRRPGAGWLVAAGLLAVVQHAWAASTTRGTVVRAQIESRALRGNLVGVDVRRNIEVYLPPGYARGSKRYPVIYFIHNYQWSPSRVFEENRLQDFVERAVERKQMGEVILVAGDFTTPTGINFFGNDVVAGRWIDHIAEELVPHVDANFRTLPTAASRGIAGHFFGGFAALKVPMLRPGLFGAAYSLHPVGTGTGLYPGMWRPDWKLVHEARTWEDLQRHNFTPIFVAMSQAYLPNPTRPPFFCDFMVEMEQGKLVPNSANIIELTSRFLLDSLLRDHPEGLKRLRALKLDWGRYDSNQDHVYANVAFSRKLEEYGITHAAEEYAGNEWNQLWVPQGRVEADLLPFFAQHLEGAAPPSL